MNGPGLAFQTLGQCLIAFFFTRVLGTGFLSRTLGLPRQGVLSSSSRMTKSGVGSHLRFLAFGSSALLERGSLSNGSAGGCFPRSFEPELEALLEGCETGLAGAHFRRLVIESSWSPKESMGSVDFFWRFSSSLHASASSFPLASPPPRITWWLVWLIGVISSRSLELFLPLRKGEGWILSESWTNSVRSGKWVRL